MAILPIYEYPHAVLRAHATTVEPALADTPSFQQMLDDMIETMYAHPNTVGLAAPQIGQSLQVFVFDVTSSTTRSNLEVVINPEILSQSKWKVGREGCLSVPKFRGMVKRARKVRLKWFDRNFSPKEEEFLDFSAVVVQHELDHLRGVLFVDRVRLTGSKPELTER